VRVRPRILAQLAIFAVIAVTAGAFLFIGYVKFPAMLGIGRYTVTVELPRSGGLYRSGNVTYRGTQVGKVEDVRLTDRGTVEAILALDSRFKIPSNLQAQVHSQSAVGEQYVALNPRDDTSAPLKDGDVVAMSNTSVPPDIDRLLDAANRGLNAIPHDSLKTAIDESYTAFGGLGPDLSRLVKGATTVGIDARANLDSLTTLIDQSAPVLNSQADTSSSIQGWASHLASVTSQIRNHDKDLAGLIDQGGSATDEVRQLLDRVKPTLPVILRNLVSVGKTAVVYQASVEQILVLVPQGIAVVQAGVVPGMDTNAPFRSGLLDFNLGLNLPPPCTTGYLPAAQRRTPSQTDAPDRIEGDLYCRIPQDAPFNVRGVRNLPCITRPGKRAPTVKMCESDENYVPLNDGYNWKGDPNGTLSGQDIPQLPVGAKPPAAQPPQAAAIAPPPPLAVAEYDPASGSYVGPDGHMYTQSDLAATAPQEKKWQDMVLPPANR
jgi:phospholipid/cholesterol/gamma-HCH transport system substrate-binding protein